MSREFIVDRCRDYIWRYDRSPARELERYESLARTLDHVMEIERQPALTHEHAHSGRISMSMPIA
jgi:hypothetical protein